LQNSSKTESDIGEMERAMSTMNLGMSVSRPYRSSFGQLRNSFAEWRFRARSRSELMNLSDSCLRDIGVSRCDVGFESSKPFWVA
jgi:uncharacterized protein YjiS (DUF1127 family)